MLNGLKSNIEDWATMRGLDTADPNKQMLKLGEEYGELCAGMARGDGVKIIDSVGDMFVVMTILCLQLNIDIGECVQSSYDEIKDRKGKMINGVFVKEADLVDEEKEICPRCKTRPSAQPEHGIVLCSPCFTSNA